MLREDPSPSLDLLRKFGAPIEAAARCVADLPQLGADDIPKHSNKVSKDKHQDAWTRDGLAETEVSFQKRVCKHLY